MAYANENWSQCLEYSQTALEMNSNSSLHKQWSSFCNYLTEELVYHVHVMKCVCFLKLQKLDNAWLCFQQLLPNTCRYFQICSQTFDFSHCVFYVRLDIANQVHIGHKFPSLWYSFLIFLLETEQAYQLAKYLLYLNYLSENESFQCLWESMKRKVSNEKYDLCLDAAWAGNQARFVNHSDHPNCELVERFIGKEECHGTEVWIRTLRAITTNEELTINYGKQYWEECNKSKPLKQRDDPWQDCIFTHAVIDNLFNHLSDHVLKETLKYLHLKYERITMADLECLPKNEFNPPFFLMRYSGIRKIVNEYQTSDSRYVVNLKCLSHVDHENPDADDNEDALMTEQFDTTV
ncbi:SET domain-containing protein [Reticulomyxa filosa]|uniref:SET domain-containing protein n=1 Tax=Reticulomyxa filosa TaxID=46433 RepID=X6LX61_RETFI|nr:SET domain-containing protein [Reticulomyxa filosa]|eukprot:ETO06214.1 SET domain-containing protein [Reticulomyxa filosa]